jgi:hypothetical protein
MMRSRYPTLEWNNGFPINNDLCACCPGAGNLSAGIRTDGVSERSGYRCSNHLLRLGSPCARVVHSEPRYQALIKRMGLPPAW